MLIVFEQKVTANCRTLESSFTKRQKLGTEKMFALCISWSLALQLFLPCRISRGRTPQRRSQKGCFKHRMSEVWGLGDVRATCPLSQGHSWPAVAFCPLCATLCVDGAGTRGLASRLAPPGMSLPCSTQEHRENSGERTD